MRRTHALIVAITTVIVGVGLFTFGAVHGEFDMAVHDPLRYVGLSVICVAQAWGLLAVHAQYRGVYDRRTWWLRPHRAFAQFVRPSFNTPTPR